MSRKILWIILLVAALAVVAALLFHQNAAPSPSVELGPPPQRIA